MANTNINIRPIFSLACMVLTAVISAICVIWLYLGSSLPVKLVLSFFLLIAAATVWFSAQKKVKIFTMSGEALWQEIHSALKELEQTRTYVLKLDSHPSAQHIYKSEDTIYIGITNPEHLCGIASRLFEYHTGKTVALGVELSVYPALSNNTGAYLKDCLRNLLFLQKQLHFTIPVNLVIHAPKNLFHPQTINKLGFTLKHQADQQESDIVKFLDTFQEVLLYSFLHKADQTHIPHDYYFRASQVIASIQDIFHTQTGSGWSYVNIRSATLVADSIVDSHSLWQRFLSQTTGGLKWPQSGVIEHADTSVLSSNSPDTFYRKNMLWDLILKLLAISTVAFIAAAFCSAHNNRELLKKISEHIAELKANTSQSSLAYRQAKEELLYDLETLRSYQRNGEPIQLGLGLYRGEILIPQIEQFLHQPLLSKPEINPPKKPEPVVLTLDSLALFETGQYELKHNANKALIGVLKAIEQHPDTQIMVEGHTDNIGSKSVNQQLSEKRALAVRDWLIISSNLPATRFAVKGYGDTRPIAENLTEEGRAKNRRVEIILIPKMASTAVH